MYVCEQLDNFQSAVTDCIRDGKIKNTQRTGLIERAGGFTGQVVGTDAC
jgi:hypothetical protein